MADAEGRTIHDADSHVMETPDWFFAFADPGIRERMEPIYVATVAPGEETLIEQAARLHPVGYGPLADFERSARMAGEAIELGCAALMIPSACPRTHSPSHIGLDPVWSQAEEARRPIVFHVGGGGKLLDPMYFENGLPPVPDFHGGDGNFRSVDYMAIQYPPMQTLATMIIDGVLDRHPTLRVG